MRAGGLHVSEFVNQHNYRDNAQAKFGKRILNDRKLILFPLLIEACSFGVLLLIGGIRQFRARSAILDPRNPRAALTLTEVTGASRLAKFPANRHGQSNLKKPNVSRAAKPHGIWHLSSHSLRLTTSLGLDFEMGNSGRVSFGRTKVRHLPAIRRSRSS